MEALRPQLVPLNLLRPEHVHYQLEQGHGSVKIGPYRAHAMSDVIPHIYLR